MYRLIEMILGLQRDVLAQQGEYALTFDPVWPGQAHVPAALWNLVLVAIVLVYFLMVILFQSWIDPFITMFAVPGALVGILWMLAVTGTTINVESLMGSIMAVGIAVSNSILLVSFANVLRYLILCLI